MSRELFTLSYPELARASADWIDNTRMEPVPAIRPHFTLAFGVSDLAEETYVAHVAEIAARHRRIRFHCRRVVVGTDHHDERGYAFLVPDEGASGFHQLHDALYRGPLARSLNLKAPYTPHMTLGQYPTTTEAKVRCDDLNRGSISVSGLATRLSIIALEDDRFFDVASFELSSDGYAS